MNKLKFNYIVDFLLLISFLVTGLTAIIASVFLPGGFSRAGQQIFLGLTRHAWLDVHGWAGYIVIILVFVHLVLHRTWIAQVTKIFFKREQQQKQESRNLDT